MSAYVTVEMAPGPSLFDQKAMVSGFEQQQQPVKMVYYRAVYPFDARSHDEISIAPGDVIMVCSMHINLVPIHFELGAGDISNILNILLARSTHLINYYVTTMEYKF